jgi:hypothetical protein
MGKMVKLPVFKTVGQTFGFVVERRFFSLLRLIWLPALVSMVLGILPILYLHQTYGVIAPPSARDGGLPEFLKGLDVDGKKDAEQAPDKDEPTDAETVIKTDDVTVTIDTDKKDATDSKDVTVTVDTNANDGAKGDDATVTVDVDEEGSKESDDVNVKVTVDGVVKVDAKVDKELARKIEADGTFTALQILNTIAQILFSAMIAVSVHRMILLGDLQKGVFFYWRLTREEWLYILAWILYGIVICVVLALPWFAYFYYLTSQGGGGPAIDFSQLTSVDGVVSTAKQLSGATVAIAIVLSLSLALIAAVRFGLVFPIIVAENRLSFWRSWVVTRGNFWRLIGFWIVVNILAGLLIALVVAIMVAVAIAMLGGVMAGGESVGALSVLILAVPAAIALAVYLVVGITIFIAGMSFTYKALAGDVEHAGGGHSDDHGDDGHGHGLGHH